MKVLIVTLASLFVTVLSSPTGNTLSSAPATGAAVPTPIGSTVSATAKASTAAVASAATTAVNSTSDATSCAHHRQRETNSNTRLPGRLIPECRPDGKYASLQCHGEAVGGGKFCQCWDPEGNIIRAPSKKVKACDCILQRHQLTNERPRRIGAFIPACEESGHFKKHQCHGSTGHCWCAHPSNGTQIGERTRGLAAESCA